MKTPQNDIAILGAFLRRERSFCIPCCGGGEYDDMVLKKEVWVASLLVPGI
jgi:hypothetical protein